MTNLLIVIMPDPSAITPQEAIASLTNIAPFLWPFVLLSLGVALTPVSPISWSYSTWLLFIIPLIITVFAPIRTFSGPLRYAYLEYATKISSLTVSLLSTVVTNFHSIPALALPALFFLPVLPIFFFIFFPALPVIWHFIAYHYRRRLNAITASVAKTNASLDLYMARAIQSMALAHTYEKQALYTVSTRSTPLLALTRHSTDFGTVFNDSEGHRQLIQTPGTLGATLAGQLLETEKQMALIEDASQRVRALSEQAVAVATEGDMAAGQILEEEASQSLKNVVNQVDHLRSIADEVRCTWVELRSRLNKITSSASMTTARLELAVTQARQGATQALIYEKQALEFISTTRRTAFGTIALHNADFFARSGPAQQARQMIGDEARSVRELGRTLTEKMSSVDAIIGDVESEVEPIRAMLEEAVTASVDGDVAKGEKLTAEAAACLKDVTGRVQELCLTSDRVREDWLELSLRSWAIPA